MIDTASVFLWGSRIGAVTWQDARETAVFQYDPSFARSGIEPAPLMMPVADFPYEFPALPKNAFKGLPGLLADSLPDKYGNSIIDAWLAAQGRTAASFHPVERLCYIGKSGMGALEFEPSSHQAGGAHALDVTALVALANQVLDSRKTLGGAFSGGDDRALIDDILRVGTSAGGARAKAILAWNPATNEFRSGQVGAESGFEHWLMKFDGVSNNRDKELADPQGYGRIEYAYALMAADAGVEMMECRLHHEGGRSHFMTKRFDRSDTGGKRHMQSLGAIAHYDYNQPASYSYEQALQIIRLLNLPMQDMEQQILRTIFNVIARNQDDHVKNIAFLMNRQGAWRLSPAFDVSYSWDPNGAWTSQHQMSVNGKRDHFARSDLLALADFGGVKKTKARDMIERVLESVRRWPDFAAYAGVEESRIAQIQRAHRIL